MSNTHAAADEFNELIGECGERGVVVVLPPPPLPLVVTLSGSPSCTTFACRNATISGTEATSWRRSGCGMLMRAY